MGISYYVEGIEVVTRTMEWRSDMKMKVQWDLVEIGLGAPLKLLGRWNKTGKESVVAMMGMRLKTTRMQLYPKERGWSRMNQKVHIIVIGTVVM